MPRNRSSKERSTARMTSSLFFVCETVTRMCSDPDRAWVGCTLFNYTSARPRHRQSTSHKSTRNHASFRYSELDRQTRARLQVLRTSSAVQAELTGDQLLRSAVQMLGVDWSEKRQFQTCHWV